MQTRQSGGLRSPLCAEPSHQKGVETNLRAVSAGNLHRPRYSHPPRSKDRILQWTRILTGRPWHSAGFETTEIVTVHRQSRSSVRRRPTGQGFRSPRPVSGNRGAVAHKGAARKFSGAAQHFSKLTYFSKSYVFFQNLIVFQKKKAPRIFWWAIFSKWGIQVDESKNISVKAILLSFFRFVRGGKNCEWIILWGNVWSKRPLACIFLNLLTKLSFRTV